jgi:hypothetical protein
MEAKTALKGRCCGETRGGARLDFVDVRLLGADADARRIVFRLNFNECGFHLSTRGDRVRATCVKPAP